MLDGYRLEWRRGHDEWRRHRCDEGEGPIGQAGQDAVGPRGRRGDANSCYENTMPDNVFASENEWRGTERRWIYVQGSVPCGASRGAEEEYNNMYSECETMEARVRPGPAGLEDRETSYYDTTVALSPDTQ